MTDVDEKRAAELLKYAGVNAWGGNAAGATQSTPENLTRALFRRRYRTARVTNAEGRLVGKIGVEPGTRRRTWWAES